jgi:hypothetical protein
MDQPMRRKAAAACLGVEVPAAQLPPCRQDLVANLSLGRQAEIRLSLARGLVVQ